MNTLPVKLRSTLIAAAISALVLTAGSARADFKVGDTLPELKDYKLEGNLPKSLAGKVVLVDFWASWCGPCAASFPVMEELHQRFKDKGLVVLAVSVDEKAAKMDAFVKKHNPTFPVVRDAESKLVADAGVDAMPTSFLIDKQGKIRRLHNGFHGKQTKEQYFSEIEALLNE